MFTTSRHLCPSADLDVGGVLVLARPLARGTQRQLRVHRQTLDIVRVAAVVALRLNIFSSMKIYFLFSKRKYIQRIYHLALRAVEDGEAGHVVDDLPGGQGEEVAAGVLAAVAVHPLQPRGAVGSLGLDIYLFISE